MHEWLGKHLEATYGITVDARSMPQSWNPHVLRIDRRQGEPWIARVFPPSRSAAQVHGDAAILRFLEASAFPAERCATDEPVSVYDGQHVLVTSFVAGTTPTDLRAMGERLGWLHSLDVGDAITRDGGSWHGDPAYEGLPACDLAHGIAMLDAVRDRVTPHAIERVDSLRSALSAADDCGDLPRALVHADPAPVNAIASPTDGIVLIDWAGCGLGPRVASLVLVALGDPAAAVAGYREHVPALTDDELDRLEDAVRIRDLFWNAYYFARTVSAGTTPSGGEGWWVDDDRIASVAASIRAAFTA